MNRLLKNHKLMAIMAAIAGVILFSSKAILVKKAYNYNIDTISLLLLRMAFALPFYVIIAFIQGIKQKSNKILAKDYFSLITLGIIGYYFASYLDFEGLNYITASLERLILFIYPSLVVIISAIFLKKAISYQQKLAVIITYIGIFIAFYKYIDIEEPGSNLPLGAGLIFGSALSYAIYLVGSGSLIPRIGAVKFTSYVMIISCLAVLIHFAIKEDSKVLNHTNEVYYLSIAMAVLCTIIPSYLLSAAINEIGSSNVAIIGSIGPISTIILAYIFLGESIGAYQFTGTAIVILGVLLIALTKNKPIIKTRKFGYKLSKRRSAI